MLVTLAAILLGTATSPALADPTVSIVDDLGREVVLDGPARRIAVLYPAFSEILAAMGLEDHIAARTASDSLAEHAPAVGTHMRPNLELIVAAQPDLAIHYGGRSQALATVDQLQNHGIPTAVFHPATIEALYSVTARLGTLTGRESDAQALIAGMQSDIQAVTLAVGNIPQNEKPTVFFEVRSPELLAAGQESIVTDVIRLAGGINCVTAPERLVHLGEEALVGLDPEVYIIQVGPMNPNPAPLAERPLYAALSATQSGRALLVDEAMFSRPGPRLARAVAELAAFLHPNCFP